MLLFLPFVKIVCSHAVFIPFITPHALVIRLAHIVMSVKRMGKRHMASDEGNKRKDKLQGDLDLEAEKVA